MSEHARLSPSGAYRWMACPGSVLLSSTMPEVKSVYAETGTAAHKLAEKCLKEWQPAEAFIGHAFNGFEVTDEMADAVQYYIDTVWADVSRKEIAAGVKSLHIEFKSTWNGITDIRGTADAVITAGDKISVYDYKNGVNVVPVHNNAQLKIYALGAMYELLKPDTKWVEMVIVQPNAFSCDPARRCTISVDELKAWGKKELLPAIKRVDEEPTHYVAGDHCRWCKAQAICPEQKHVALKAAQMEFASTPPAPETLTPAQIGEVLRVAAMVSSWADSVKDHALALMEGGAYIPGYKLVRKRTLRRWIAGQETTVERLFGDKAFEKKLISPAKAEKLKLVSKEALENLYEQPEGALTIAPEDDKRKEQVSPVIEDFKPR